VVGFVQISAPFDYARAESVDDAIALLERHGPEARVLAGGHSLLPMMKLRLARPEWLIDINDLAELDFITEAPDMVRIGAMTRHTTLLESPVMARLFPIVADAERVIADPVVRNRGTIGGSLCQADPAEDLSTVCDVLRAKAVIRGAAGKRVIEISELRRGPYETSVAQNELLTEIRLPVRARSGSAYEKVERRVGDWAVAAAGASVVLAADGRIEDVAIGLTAVRFPPRNCSPRPAGSLLRTATRSRTNADRSTTSDTSRTSSLAASSGARAPSLPREVEPCRSR
jgi:carbon-monoxide dehydrogenase medium subunit